MAPLTRLTFGFALVAALVLVLGFGADLARAQSSTACNGHGTQDASGNCVCEPGYAGSSCGACAVDYYSYPACRFCDRVSTCSAHGSCGTSGFCQCDGGFAGAACDACQTGFYGPTCAACPSAGGAICGGHGSCSDGKTGTGLCTCAAPYFGVACQFALFGLTPAHGPATGGTSVTITGAGFGAAPGSVTVGGATGAITQWSSTNILFVTPAGSGQQPVQVVTSGGDVLSAGLLFTYDAADTVAITCLNPTVVVPPTASTCSAFPTPAEIFSVQDPTAQCTIDPAGPYALGTSSVRVSCSTPSGASTSAQCSMTVVESLPQVACPDVTVACTGGLPQQPQGTSLCSAVDTRCTLNTGAPWVPGDSLGAATGYTCTAETPGGANASCSGRLVTTDVGPVVQTYPGMANLWPPNHKMQAFELSDCISSAVDACTGQPINIDARARVVRVTSDECAKPRIDPAGTVQLPRERDGAGNGRVYTLHFEVAGHGGSTTSGTCKVGVPHSANGAAPVDDGPRSCVGEGCPALPACR